MQEFIAFANTLADEAGEIVRTFFRQPFDIQSKADHSPVTIADRKIEERLRALIEEHRPDDGILGEEFGEKKGRNNYTWVIDPIDGTKSFAMGRPTFGTLIALCRDGVPVLGIIDQAILRERWVGAEGQPTTMNGVPVRTRACASLAEACAASTTPAMFSDTVPVHEILERECKMVAWGGDCYAYGLLASGHLDLVVEAQLSPYDFCALVPIVEGAGGIMTDWDGQPLNINSDGRVIALCDQNLSCNFLEV